VCLVETREDVRSVLEMDQDIDLMIPRGSADLVRFIQGNTRIPVLGHADGVCHLYIDETAEPGMAVRLAVDSKTQYPAVCNAIETLLIHSSHTALLPQLRDAMPDVELRGCTETQKHIEVAPASADDWKTEYNDMILSVRVVSSLDEAVDHINAYGSHHTDSIVTSDRKNAHEFQTRVDSSSVLWNASTRFADGFRYGLGAEVGISTGKVHARGPVGLEGLTTTQYRVAGAGHIVKDYAVGKKAFTHKDLP
jgi:glutamate-5-semialdehyde dehydrogenase